MALLTTLIIQAYACSTLRVPAAMPSFPTAEILRISRAGVTLEARPVVTRDDYWELFDDHLPEVGIVAVWINLRNGRSEEISSGTQWSLRLAGRRYRAMNSDALFDRYYEGRSIRMYSINTDRKARIRLETLRFHPGRIAAATEHNGFLFFPVEPSRASNWHSEATLVSSEIRTSEKTPLVLELPLSYADSQR
jgi:hypothetical protein